MNRKYVLLFFLIVSLVLIFLVSKREKQGELLLLEIPNGAQINVVTLADQAIRNKHPVLSQFNNITISDDEVFLSQYRFSNKDQQYEAGNRIIVLDRHSLRKKQEIILQGQSPTDIFVYKDKLFVKVRFLNTGNSSGFEVYSLKTKQFLQNLDLREDFMNAQWALNPPFLYVCSDGIHLFKKNSPNVPEKEKKYASGYAVLFKFDLNSLQLLEHKSFGKKITSVSDLQIFKDALLISSVAQYSSNPSDSNISTSDAKLFLVDPKSGSVQHSYNLVVAPKKILVNPEKNEIYISSLEPIFQILSFENDPPHLSTFNIGGIRDMYLLDTKTLLLNQRASFLSEYKKEPKISYFDLIQRKITHEIKGTYGPFPRIFNQGDSK